MYRNRWTYATSQALITLAINLIVRAVWWSDKPLLSWNVPLNLALGFALGLLLFPVFQYFDRKRQAELKALEAQHAEIMKSGMLSRLPVRLLGSSKECRYPLARDAK